MLLKHLFLLTLWPYFWLRGWLQTKFTPRAETAPLLHFWQLGQQAAASDVQYALAVLVCLPLLVLLCAGLWQAWLALTS